MHIKKFEGRDLQEALARIRRELGPDAVILESGREAGGGVSVLAALPHAIPEEALATAGGSRAPRAESASARSETTASRPAAVAAASWPRVAAEAPAFAAAAASSRPTSASVPSSAAPTRLASGPAWDAPAAAARPAATAWTPAKATPRAAGGEPTGPSEPSASELSTRVRHLNRLVRSDHFSAIPLPLRQLYFDLTDAEVDADLVFQILQRMGTSPLPGQFTPAPPGELLQLLRTMVETSGAIGPAQGRRVLALVGPTGVGKTTTAAKIAGLAAFRLGLDVALLSTDSYRVFGAQHLSSYAALMGLPFELVSTAAELRWYLQGRMARSDLILIDTSGRSPRDPRGIGEISSLLAACPELDVHLVLSASTRARDLALACRSFSLLPVRHLIFTKLDEATSLGGAFTTTLKARRPVSYLGTGQEVPDDLVPATPALLTDRLLEASDE